ncbi:hypothetical protein C6T64_17550 [Burkholderia cenocepacia]|nr:hypothetical protein C6T64_17550 [Burkholderia cenocepacia]
MKLHIHLFKEKLEGSIELRKLKSFSFEPCHDLVVGLQNLVARASFMGLFVLHEVKQILIC